MKRIKTMGLVALALLFHNGMVYSQSATDGMVDAINQMGGDENLDRE